MARPTNAPGMLEIDRLTEALAGRYRIERELGRGGMATVHLAHDLRHDRLVAIKVLNPELGAWLGVERFLAEIRTTARLQHPNILSLLDSGDVEGSLFYVMPYVAGETLRERLRREQQLPVAEAVRIAKEVAAALGHAHAKGVIHRDIKPENILLGPAATGSAVSPVLVADFGIARSLDTVGDRLTASGLTVGTAAYMSPEQATAERAIDGRSDIYSLGCVLYEMLAGEPPFTGPNPRAILSKQLSDPVRPVRRVRDSVPQHIDAALATALGRSPADRFPTAEAFTAALEGSSTARRFSPRVAVGIAVGLAVGLGAWAALWRPTEASGMPSVRVQRFTTPGGDTASAYLAATLQQDVIATLAGSRSARVFAMDSAKLPAGFAVTATAARRADSVEVKITVVREPLGDVVGTPSVSRPLSRVYEIPGAATDAILELVGRPRARAVATRRPSTRDSIAYDYYLRGRFQTDRRTEAATQRAVAFFLQAVARDSNFAEGWAGLTRALHQANLRRYLIPGIRPDSLLPRLIDASERALDADTTRSYVWVARALAVREIEPTSRRSFLAALARAIALDSSDADAWHYAGVAWEDSLVPDRALDAFRHAIRIDPTHRQALGFMSHHYMWERQYDSMLVWADSGIRIDPAHILIRQSSAMANLLLDRLAAAAAEFRSQIRVSQGRDEAFGWVGLADIANRERNRLAADTLLARAIAIVDTLHPTVHEAAYLAWGYAALGDTNRAVRLLERYEPRADVHFQLHLQRDPLLDPLRSLPSFDALLVRRDAMRRR